MTGTSRGANVSTWQTQVVVAGDASGPALCLEEPLSMWGGLDSTDGTIIDARHPQVGACATATVLVMATGRGSSSASSVLVEAVAEGTAPAAFLLGESDSIIALGAVVASELYGIDVPVVVGPDALLATLGTGMQIDVHRDGRVVVHSDPDEGFSAATFES